MPSTMKIERGEFVLVRFVFADEKGAKRRPVLVISTSDYLSGRQEVVVAAVTSNVQRVLPGDLLLNEWKAAGLPKPSVLTGILRTIKQRMIERKLGRIAVADLRMYEDTLREVLGL